MRFIASLLLAFVLSPYAVLAAAETSNSHSTDLESGSSQYWSIADGTQSGLDGGSMTISVWAKFESLPASGDTYALVGKRNGTGNQRSYYAYIVNSSGTYRMGLQTDNDGTAPVDVTGDGITITTGVWYNFQFKYTSGTGAIAFYQDNVAKGTGTGETSIFNSTSGFNIGRIDDGVFYFDGLIDSVLFYNAALDDTTRGALYTAPCDPSTTSLVSWWRFNNDGNDSQGSNNLTNNNSATFSTDVAYSCASAASPADDTEWFLLLI